MVKFKSDLLIRPTVPTWLVTIDLNNNAEGRPNSVHGQKREEQLGERWETEDWMGEDGTPYVCPRAEDMQMCAAQILVLWEVTLKKWQKLWLQNEESYTSAFEMKTVWKDDGAKGLNPDYKTTEKQNDSWQLDAIGGTAVRPGALMKGHWIPPLLGNRCTFLM